MIETIHVSLSEYYSDSDLEKPLAAPERGRESKSPDLAESDVEAQATGSHVKDRVLTRSPSSDRTPVSDKSQRERTPCHQNIDVTKRRRRRRRRRSTRAPGASENATAAVPRIHKMQEVPSGSDDSERDLFSDDWQVHEQQKNASLARASNTRKMHYINGLPTIVRLFASGWFPSDMYEPLLKASEYYRPMGDMCTAKAIERFSEALLYTSNNKGAELNINLLHIMSQLRQTRRAYAHEYTELSEQQTSQVIWQFSTDFLLSPHQTALPATTQRSLMRHIINNEMGCEYRVRAIIQVGLSRFDTWDAHDIKDLARKLLYYITAIEDLAATLLEQDQRYEHTRQSQSSGCQKRSKITRRARPWHRPTKHKRLTFVDASGNNTATLALAKADAKALTSPTMMSQTLIRCLSQRRVPVERTIGNDTAPVALARADAKAVKSLTMTTETFLRNTTCRQWALPDGKCSE